MTFGIRSNRALALKPNFAEASNNLGNTFKEAGELNQAVIAYRRAIALDPARAAYLSNLIFVSHLHPAGDGLSLREEQVRWNHLHAEPLRPERRPHGNVPEPWRRLKIGYVSPDFRAHPMAFFLTPLLAAHDRQACEVYCYASVRRPDAVTERLRKSADLWRDVYWFSDLQLSECVRDDGIDILVDLAMHTAGNRLPVFARQPAPVQVSWPAYPGSTGMEAIDYRLTDAHIDPAGQEETGPGEKAVRLPDSWCCYAPIETFPDVGPMPASHSGTVTFGSLNRFDKIGEEQLRCWAALLGAVAEAQLLMICPQGRTRERVHALFTSQGIARDRVELIAPGPWSAYV